MGFRFVAALLFYALIYFCAKIYAQGYLKGDFHQHTTYTDGSFTIECMMMKNNQLGLDWWAFSAQRPGYRAWMRETTAQPKPLPTYGSIRIPCL